MKRAQALRILDANLNRSREGLRVCEEVARFFLGERLLTRDLKAARHAVTACFKRLDARELLAARDARGDVGRAPSALERGRDGARDLFLANSQRAKEALRVLEEASGLIDAALPPRFKRIRFAVYDIEKRALPQLEAVHDHRPPRRARKGSGRSRG